MALFSEKATIVATHSEAPTYAMMGVNPMQPKSSYSYGTGTGSVTLQFEDGMRVTRAVPLADLKANKYVIGDTVTFAINPTTV